MAAMRAWTTKPVARPARGDGRPQFPEHSVATASCAPAPPRPISLEPPSVHTASRNVGFLRATTASARATSGPGDGKDTAQARTSSAHSHRQTSGCRARSAPDPRWLVALALVGDLRARDLEKLLSAPPSATGLFAEELDRRRNPSRLRSSSRWSDPDDLAETARPELWSMTTPTSSSGTGRVAEYTLTMGRQHGCSSMAAG